MFIISLFKFSGSEAKIDLLGQIPVLLIFAVHFSFVDNGSCLTFSFQGAVDGSNEVFFGLAIASFVILRIHISPVHFGVVLIYFIFNIIHCTVGDLQGVSIVELIQLTALWKMFIHKF